MVNIDDIEFNEDGFCDMLFHDIEANSSICELGRHVFGTSYDSKYAFSAMIIDAFENTDNTNPPIRVNGIYKRINND